MRNRHLIHAIFNRRMLSILILGVSAGLPLALVGATLQAWFTMAGISLLGIGALTLVGQPYVYKFVWAPLMDRYVPPLLGRRRGWILLWQIMLTFSLIVLSFFHPQKHAALMGTIALTIAFFSASQDIGIDAYRTDVLLEEERGFGSALYVGGYRLGLIVSGGVALIMAQYIGWCVTYIIMGVIILLCSGVTLFAPEPEIVSEPKTLAAAVYEPFHEFLTRPQAWVFLLLILLYKFGDAFALSLISPFLLKGLHFSLAEVGAVNKIFGIAATIVGVFLGGVVMVRLSLYRAMFLFGVLMAVSNLAYMGLSIIGHNMWALIMAVAIENICSGLGTVAFLAFLMSLCDHRYTATQFAVLSAIAAIGRVFIGPMAAVLVDHLGWTQFFFWSVLISIPSLILLWILRYQPCFAVVTYENNV